MSKLLLIVLLGLPALASAQAINLVCEGVAPTYQGGFGATAIDSDSKSSRLVSIDQTSNTVRIETLFAEKTECPGRTTPTD